ncbi:MAG: sulfatase activating formylglycine-generating enzyme [Rhodothermales bacterium]|jgi:formylglycine-generating enzyme required for sulfatase activity
MKLLTVAFAITAAMGGICAPPPQPGASSTALFVKLGFDTLATAKVDKPYSQDIPGVDVTFDMLPIPKGSFMMGSPATEAKREKNEGPQRKVQLDAF